MAQALLTHPALELGDRLQPQLTEVEAADMRLDLALENGAGRDRVRSSRQPLHPGRFHTKVFNVGVEPAIQIHYRASKVRQYVKEGRAVGTETTVNDTLDFGIGRRLTQANWDALVNIGHRINERLLGHQLEACQCGPDATTLQRVVPPSKENAYPPPARA